VLPNEPHDFVLEIAEAWFGVLHCLLPFVVLLTVTVRFASDKPQILGGEISQFFMT
jgi:hypothetical protein